MLFTPKPLATRSTGCAPTITYKVEYGIRANHIQELGREQNSLMLKMKRISLQTFFMPLAVASSGAQADAMADGASEACDLHDIPAVSVTSTSISVVGPLGEPVAGASSSSTTSFNSNVANSLPSRSSPPPSFLLDEDPFANLASVKVGTNGADSRSSVSSIIPHTQRPHPELVPAFLPPSQRPKSRLQEAVELDGEGRRAKSQDTDKEPKKKRKRAKTFFVTMSAPVSPSKASSSSKASTTDPTTLVPPLSARALNLMNSVSLPSSPKLPTMSNRVPPLPPGHTLPTGRIQPRPAHQRPAFAARPSLPSLDTLTKTNVVLTKKVRKGHVGAGLPFEPWDNVFSDDDFGSSHQTTTPVTGSTAAQVNPAFPPDVGSAVTFDRTHPNSVPTSPTRSFRLLAPSLATPPPQPLLPSQVVALGAFIEHLEMDFPKSHSHSPPLQTTPLLKPDDSILPSLPLSSTLTTNPCELDPAMVAPALPPSVSEDLEVPASKVFEPELESMQPTYANGPAAGEESSYFNGDLLDGYGISLTSENELLDYPRYWAAAAVDQQGSVNDSRQEPDADGEAQLQAGLRWSVETDESSMDTRTHSGTHSPSDPYSNSCTESFSDLFTMHSCPPPFSYSYGYSTSDSTTDVSRVFSLSRSISSTSFSSSSFDEEVHSSQSTNSSLDTYEQVQYGSSKSGDNSLLHSPDTEWMSFTNPSFLPQVEAELLGPSVSRLEGGPAFAKVDDLAQPQAHGVPLQTTPIETAIHIPATSALQDYEQHNEEACDISNHVITSTQPNDAVDSNAQSRSTPGSDANGLPATADDLFLTPPSTISFSSSSPAPLLQDELSTVTTAKAPDVLSSDHTTLVVETPSYFRANPIPIQLQDENQDMIDPSRREQVGYVAGVEHESPYRGYHRPLLSSREAKHTPGHVGYTRSAGSAIPKEIPLSLDSRSQSRSVSRSTSVMASKLPPPKQQFPSSTSSTETSDEDEDDHDDGTSSDDDIPLAQRIPGALTAQRVIRRQVKEERRAERERRHRERQITLRPAGGMTMVDSQASQAVSLAIAIPHPTNNHTAATADSSLVSRHLVPKQRPRTNTMPSKPSAPEFGQAFNAEDLAMKLQTVKMMAESSTSLASSVHIRQPQPTPLSHASSLRRAESKSAKMMAESSTFMASSIHVRQPQTALLSHASSLRRSESKSKQRYDQSHPGPYSVGASPSTSAPHVVPTLKSKRSLEYRTQILDQTSVHKRSMSISRGDKEGTRQVQDGSIPPLPSPGRISTDDHRDRGRRVLVKPQADPRTTPTTISPEVERYRERPSQPSTNGGLTIDALGPTTKQRIFIHTIQHPHLVDIGPMTSAGDLIASCEADGTLNNWAGLGGWMVWEIAQDFGMERPVRSYELLSEVQASWLKEKTINYFLLKKTLLSEPLGRSAIPSSAPTHSGWVEWESKRGKWSKRWMHLKENTIHLSKKDGRDETLLCSLSNFDAYYITRSLRTPKSFAFTIKSTDSLSFFENTDDYMHTISCSEKDGEAWVKKILMARSYVLHQERHALFNPQTTANPVGIGASITRSSTRRTVAPKPIQPLVNLSTGGIFEPGSLLSKQQGSQQP